MTKYNSKTIFYISYYISESGEMLAVLIRGIQLMLTKDINALCC